MLLASQADEGGPLEMELRELLEGFEAQAWRHCGECRLESREEIEGGKID